MAGFAKISLVMRHEAWRSSGRRGLTPTQSQVLAIVAGSRRPLGITSIARHLAVTPGTTSEAISALTAKGFVEKVPDARDRRALVIRLTPAGRSEAAHAAQWPDSMLEAIESLPPEQQTTLLRGLIGMVRSLQERGAVPTARMCAGCRYFRPNRYRGASKPHHCLFIDAPIADSELRLDCDDMEPVETASRSGLWNAFVNGTPFTPDQQGHRPSPSEIGPRTHHPTGELKP